MENLENYTKESLTVGKLFANLFALFLFIPVIILFGGPFLLIWQESFPLTNIDSFSDKLIFGGMSWETETFLLILVIGIILHELIHGISWAKYAGNGFKSIKFGVMWKALAPYCHCKEPLKVKHYIIGAVMPGIILGIIPAIAAIVTGSPALLVFGIIFTGAAGGDFLMIYKLRNESMNSLVQDHPSEIGCVIYRENS